MADSAPGTQLAPTVPTLPARRTGRYGPFARWLFRRLFDAVPFPVEAVPPLRKLAQEATLVYVLRSSSLLHLIYFNWTFWKLRLPLARAATGLGYRIFGPFARWYLGGPQVRARKGGEVGHVLESVRRGEAAMVFLRAPRTLPSAVTTLPDPFPALVELQRAQARPIALVPLTFLWRKRPKKLGGSWRDALFGDPDEPGAIRTFLGYLFNRKSSYLKVGETVSLADVNAMNAGAEPARVARRVRGWLHQHLARETRVVTGPPLKSADRVVDETLRDLQLRRTLAEIARGRGLLHPAQLQGRPDLLRHHGRLREAASPGRVHAGVLHRGRSLPDGEAIGAEVRHADAGGRCLADRRQARGVLRAGQPLLREDRRGPQLSARAPRRREAEGGREGAPLRHQGP